MCKEMEKETGLNIRDEPEAYIEEVETRILRERFDDIMEYKSGLPPRITQTLMHTTLSGPIVLELVHMNEIGISAFTLDEVRQSRDRHFHQGLLDMVRDRKFAFPSDLKELKEALPKYPRKTLQLFLTDGTSELEALELRPLPLTLGVTPMGMKV